MGFLKNVFSLLLAAWLTSGTDAYGSEDSFESRSWAGAMQVETNEKPLGGMEDSQSSSSTESYKEMEEDDDFKSEYTFLASQHYELLTLQYLVLQEHVFSEHHPEIVSPPPQA